MYFTSCSSYSSDADDDYQYFCESCIDLFLETNNEEYFDSILNEDLYHKTKRILRQNKGKAAIAASILGTVANYKYTKNKIKQDIGNAVLNRNLKDAILNPIADVGVGGIRQTGLVGLNLYGIGSGTNAYIKQYKNRPKSVIAKKIQSLRNVYAKWLKKANNAIEDREAGIAKKIAAKIMNIIDGLLHLLQRKADGQ